MNVKLIGSYVQHLEVTLDPGEEFFAEKGALIYLQPGIGKDIELNGKSLMGVIGARFSGESLFILAMKNHSPVPRKLAIGGKCGLLPVKNEYGQSIVCHRGAYVGSSRKMNVSTKLSIQGLIGGLGLRLQKITGEGTVILDTYGTPITLDLQPGEQVEVDEKHVIALQGIDESRMQANFSFRNYIGGEGLSMLILTGPGRVFITPGPFPAII